MSEALGKYTHEQVAEILSLFEDGHNGLEWETEGGRLVSFYVGCNDIFLWGCADGEEIEPEDIPDLRTAMSDADGNDWWPELWIARKREMRPQGAVLNGMKAPRKVTELFLTAGPERRAEIGNPEEWKGFGDGEASE